MSTTLATKQQSEAIKQRMAEIRTDLPYAADVARERVKELTDWKYHIARRPLPIVAAAVLVGYLVVPSKRNQDRVVVHHEPAVRGRHSGDDIGPAKKGLLGGIVGAVASFALKQASVVAVNQVSGMFNKRGSE